MKALQSVLFILALFPFAQGASATTYIGTVNARSGVHVRYSPNGRVVTSLAHGKRFQITGRRGNWYTVRMTSGRVGYIYSRYVDVQTEGTYCTTCARAKAGPVKKAARDLRAVNVKLTSYAQGRYSPIMVPFLTALRQCAPGCSYQSWGVWGDARHQRKHSCHNSGSAIDIPGLVCGGRAYRAGSSRFSQFVGCMKSKRNLYVIFGHGEHTHHAHISLRSCEIGHVGKIKIR
jgi:hypothetical protein